MKSYVNKILGNTLITYEELYSVLVKGEAILNSRSTSPISTDPSDLSVLKPDHFLTGDIFYIFSKEDVTAIPPNR